MANRPQDQTNSVHPLFNALRIANVALVTFSISAYGIGAALPVVIRPILGPLCNLKSLFETSTLAFESPQEKFSGHKYRQNVDWFKYYVNKFVGPDGKEKYIRFTVRIENNWTKQGIHAATVSDVAIYENENAEGRTFRAHKLRGAFRGFTDFILSHYIGKGKGGQPTFKKRQFEVIQKFNKAQDDVHAWIRSVDDIKTAREAFEADGAITDGFAPDAGPEVYAEALQTGKIKVYSSKPIENGNFVTPSRMEAKNYAGNGRI